MSDKPYPAIIERALMLACERIADSQQSYEEANTAEGWYEKFVSQAVEEDGAKTAEPLKM